MNVYKESDGIMLMDKIDDIKRKANEISLNKVEPTMDKMWDIIYTVIEFVIEKRRKIYGGFALNKLIGVVSSEDKFYDDANVKDWDIDFYSPTPIDDAKEIADRLFKKGFRYIMAGEAQHDETYKIFAETMDCADITYVPRNIYNTMPYKIVDRLYLTGPHFMMIDYLRIMTDPLTSYFRLDKSFPRLLLLLKYYPLPQITSSIEIEEPDSDLNVAFHTVHNYMIDRKSCVVVGMYAYNHLIKESINIKNADMKRTKKTVSEKKNKYANIDYITINYYEVITTNYKKDTKDLILKLYDVFPNGKKRITYQENYPFFQYFGYNVNIFFDGEMICQMYHYNGRCTPYLSVPALYFKNGSYDDEKGVINIGTFALLLLYNLVNIMKARTDGNHNTKNIYYTLISHMIELKNNYLEKTGKTIFDNSLFQEFVTTCMGIALTAQMEKAVRVEKKIKAGKKYSWRYNPSLDKDKEDKFRYIFKNSSGNEIKNIKNRKISLTNNIETDDDIIVDEEEDHDESKK